MLRSFYLLLLSVTLCANAQAAGPTAATAAHVEQLRQGGLVVYMRHGPSDAHRPDQLPLQLDNCDSQRPLSEAGRALLKTIGRDFAKL